ncbi:hypothetical protein ACJX0J_013030, partial [Zea mays]
LKRKANEPTFTATKAVKSSGAVEGHQPRSRGWQNTTLTVASPPASDLLRSLLDSSVATRSLGVVNVEEASPLRRPEEPVVEQAAPPHVAKARGGIVSVGPVPLAWGGPTLSWLMRMASPSSSTTWMRRKCSPNFGSWPGGLSQSPHPSPSSSV